ncbi:hypothetical protein RRF57_009980 [Xylaria bambusicola]|uniref:Uncharacterized protein n=1 Tax=Xylaria bambusicola TaxID=326684 RepID=A0AAN7ZCD7_9PEZI
MACLSRGSVTPWDGFACLTKPRVAPGVIEEVAAAFFCAAGVDFPADAALPFAAFGPVGATGVEFEAVVDVAGAASVGVVISLRFRITGVGIGADLPVVRVSVAFAFPFSFGGFCFAPLPPRFRRELSGVCDFEAVGVDCFAVEEEDSLGPVGVVETAVLPLLSLPSLLVSGLPVASTLAASFAASCRARL